MTPWRASGLGDDYWKADDGKNRGKACSGQTPGALRIERMANEQETGNGYRGQRGLVLIIGCWKGRQLKSARFCIIRLLPRLVWVTATANVHSALSETNEGKLLSRSTTTSTTATGGLPL